jgi:hypothetical protein
VWTQHAPMGAYRFSARVRMVKSSAEAPSCVRRLSTNTLRGVAES